MALTKDIVVDKIEVAGKYKAVQIRNLVIVKEDGTEISRSFDRYVLHPDMDISSEPSEVQGICNSVWTDEVKASWATKQSEDSE